MEGLVERTHCNEIHDALRGIKGIADAIHPLDENEKGALIVGIAPLALHVPKEVEFLTCELEALSKQVAELSHELFASPRDQILGVSHG